MERTSVPRVGRVLDLVGLFLFLVGGGIFLRAWVGFADVHHYQPGPRDPLWATIRLADRFQRLQHLGVELMAAGTAVFVIAWVTAWWLGRTAAPAESTQSAASEATAREASS